MAGKAIFKIIVLSFLTCLAFSCCRDCDSVRLPFAFDKYITGFQAGSYWAFIDTTQHDTDLVKMTLYDKGIGQKIKKQFPVDCEECGTETARMEMTGFSIHDTAQHNPVFKALVSPIGNSLLIQNADNDTVFFRDNISFQTADTLVVMGKTYRDILVLSTDSCSTGSTMPYCRSSYPYFSRLYFAKNIGLIRWEAHNHPLYGDVQYQAYTYKAVR